MSDALDMTFDIYRRFKPLYLEGKVSADILKKLDELIMLFTNFKDLVQSQNRVADQLGEAEKEISRLNKIIKSLEATAINELE